MEKVLMTVEEMRKVTGFSRPMAYQLVNREDFPKIRIGRRIMIPAKQLERWIEEQSMKV